MGPVQCSCIQKYKNKVPARLAGSKGGRTADDKETSCMGLKKNWTEGDVCNIRTFGKHMFRWNENWGR